MLKCSFITQKLIIPICCAGATIWPKLDFSIWTREITAGEKIFQTNISLQLPVPVPVPVLCHYSSPYRHLHCDTLTCGTLCQVCILRELCGGLGRGGRSNGGTQVGADWLIDFIFLNSGLQNASLIHWLNNFIELSLFYFRKLFPLCGFVLGLDVGNVTIESGNNTHLKGTVQRDFLFPIFSSFQPALATDQWDKIWSLQSLPSVKLPEVSILRSHVIFPDLI